MIITQIFVEVDDFLKENEKEITKSLITEGSKKRVKATKLNHSEIMTILIYFHVSGYRTFKKYYVNYICKYYKDCFPDLVSYNRFVELIPRVLLLLSAYAKYRTNGLKTEISFIDSTPIKVCHNRRVFSHKVFDGLANRGKSSMGWFYGFKLHLVVNEFGEIVNFLFTKASKDDRNENVIKKLTKGLKGKLIGDKGYISKKLFSMLYKDGLQLITKVRKNMKNKLISTFDKFLLQKRGLIETVNDQLKNIYQLEHTRHRSPINAMANWVSAIIAYSMRETKPSIVKQ